MENEHPSVARFINNNINIREKLRVEEVLGLMGINILQLILKLNEFYKTILNNI